MAIDRDHDQIDAGKVPYRTVVMSSITKFYCRLAGTHSPVSATAQVNPCPGCVLLDSTTTFFSCMKMVYKNHKIRFFDGDILRLYHIHTCTTPLLTFLPLKTKTSLLHLDRGRVG